eukprot:CAMPEP_0172507230 /NCGR_PEP_ID=MMETSP1066-20121228/202449_1 /TAXON_ID=671091 /ORGANISM="Coscinodiscus wailesii, Strain CCMP2513" /LENGTH=293 /DNA_ID=CAMNT_0013284711 /DNA_START=52 /DNA_END=930 /DNA_ORIENTATION=+
MSTHSFAASCAFILPFAYPNFLATAAEHATGCHEICPSGIDTGAVAKCLANPVNNAAMTTVHDTLVNLDLAAGADGDESRVLAGLTALSAQSGNAVTAEGLAFCLPGDVFYWNPDCAVAPVLCRNRTAEEIELGNIGYIVDATYHGDDLFHRYAFNTTSMVETAYQSPTLGAGYQCTALSWFKTGMCNSVGGIPLTCPEEITGSPNPFYNGWNANQYYGDVGAVVVGQQLRNVDLAPCLEELNKTNSSDDIDHADLEMEIDNDATSVSSVAFSAPVSCRFFSIFFFLSIANIW